MGRRRLSVPRSLSDSSASDDHALAGRIGPVRNSGLLRSRLRLAQVRKKRTRVERHPSRRPGRKKREKAAPVKTRGSSETIAGWSSARTAACITDSILSMCTEFLWEKPIPLNLARASNGRSSFGAMNAAWTTHTNRPRCFAMKWMFLRPLCPILSFEADTEGLAGTYLCVNHRFVWAVL